MAKILLEMKNITKTFPGVKALDDVNLRVDEGEIHALVGENGAGKSTLMNVLSGIYPYGSYEGDIIYDGEVCKFSHINDSERKGIVIIHQGLALVPYMSIAENMYLGNEKGKKYAINWNETYGEADEYLKTVGLSESSHTLIKDIGVGKQQLVEIAKALAKHARLLILDEPTASLNEDDSKALLELLLKFKSEGMTSIIISHKLNEIAYVADKITVIRDGSTIETLDKETDAITEDRIIKGMVGRELVDRFPKRKGIAVGDIAIKVQDWSVYHPLYPDRKVVDRVSFQVGKGEVVGICGLMGAGRTELAMSIFGRSYGTNITGRLFLHGKEVTLHSVRDAIRHKLAYVTEDRKGNGLILSNSVRTNTTQKVLLAKWMFAEPDILILDEPTRGIDVGAKYEIYCIINQLAAEGKSVIMISSELPEVLGMSDRIYIMNEGRMAGEVNAGEATQEYIMSCILKSDKGE